MKTTKLLNIVLALLVSIAFFSCVEDDDFSVPESLGTEENEGLQEILTAIANNEVSEISITDVKNLYNGQVTLIESDLVVKGYVTSSDQTGNFYKEFYMQDAPENPTAAVGVVLNQVDSYNQFNQGREVYIKLKGLYIGENSSEVLTIGGQEDGDEVDEIAGNQIPEYLFRSGTTETLIPLTAGPSDINESHLGMLVELENVQFPANLVGSTFVNPYDDFDTQYPLVSCDNGAELLLETSSFANFNQVPLPLDGRGNITGVITKTFGGNDIVMVLNTTDDITFNDSRCDPVFEESFNSAVDNTNLDIADWLNYAEAGGELWTEQVYSGNGYAEFTAFSTGDASNIGWLITPGIDMDAQEGEILNFQTEYAYPDAGHYPLEVFVSTDFNGTEDGISSATWEDITNEVVIAHPDVTSDWFTWVDSGPVDLSGYSGTLYIAFKYTGSDTSNQNSTIHVENVIVSVP
ncbi:MAG: DUF5017 domain-containing protein [Flavobacteriaceae bacterium]|nr:DUF5017 domain-containing protein [Flavobacteriaceae bacterium]